MPSNETTTASRASEADDHHNIENIEDLTRELRMAAPARRSPIAQPATGWPLPAHEVFSGDLSADAATDVQPRVPVDALAQFRVRVASDEAVGLAVADVAEDEPD